jgi:hypothetical protein
MIKIGSDPELFLTRGDKFISAVGKAGGTKGNPFTWAPGFNVHNDNVALEFNIPPARDMDEFVDFHHKSLTYCRSVAKQFKCNLKIVGDAVFSEDELDTPEARVFGCDPDFNAWTLEENPPPKSDDPFLRTAGGHIHIGSPDMTLRDKIELVRCLDIFVGLPLALQEPGSRRNELYGKPGAMREKPYGVEWRTPSNFWLRKTSMIRAMYEMVFTIAHRTEHFVNQAQVISENLNILYSEKEYRKWAKKVIHAEHIVFHSEIHAPLVQGV